MVYVVRVNPGFDGSPDATRPDRITILEGVSAGLHCSTVMPNLAAAGIRFVRWNGRVYEIDEDGMFRDTGWMVDEVLTE